MISCGELLLSSGFGSEFSKQDTSYETRTHWIPYSLKNHGADQEVDGMFNLGEKTMQLPLEEKMKYEMGDQGSSFGFVHALL